MRSFASILLLLLTAACGGGTSGILVRVPSEFPSYPKLANNEIIWAEATFLTDHQQIFGTDLTKKGIVPLALRVGIRDRGDNTLTYALAGESFDPHLYLQDGTALTWVPAGKVVSRRDRAADRIDERALNLSLLQDWNDSEAGFVFFAFDTDRVRVEGTKVLSTQGDVARELDLLHSLLTFTVYTDAGPREMFVGVQSGRERSR